MAETLITPQEFMSLDITLFKGDNVHTMVSEEFKEILKQSREMENAWKERRQDEDEDQDTKDESVDIEDSDMA